MFHRATGFGQAYVGSANVSHAALTDGLEWNVKISQYESPHLWRKATATFETYWNDAEFAPYGAGDRPRLKEALDKERESPSNDMTVFSVALHPYVFQQEILDKLAAERQFGGRDRHLVVAATGTGKWTAPDSLDTFLSGIGLFLVVVRAEIAQARMPPPAIIEQLDVFDNRCFGLQSGPEPSLVD